MFFVHLETGSANASFEQSKAANEVGPQDDISKVNNFGPITSGISVIQYRMVHILAAQ
jgi:hypothetical protein